MWGDPVLGEVAIALRSTLQDTNSGPVVIRSNLVQLGQTRPESPMSDVPLALDRGPPLLPAGPPAWPRPDEDVRAALAAAYADGSWGKYAGPHGERLIALLQTLCGVPQVSLCSSGTIAVELALRGLKIGSGDEVILSGYDFPGNFRAIEAVGARPVLVDLEPGTWRPDLGEVERAVGAETKAILVSHLHGSLV
jgi:perosamine synthetase